MIMLSTLMLSGCESLEGLFSGASSSKRGYASNASRPAFVSPRITRELAPTPPPPPRIDNITSSPGSGYIWMDGYWSWSGGKYSWSNGRWAPAMPGQFWIAPHWKQERAGWRLHPGYWKKTGKH